MSAASARQSQRVLIDAPVRLTLHEASRTLPARALDLSEGGMRVSAEAPLSVGDEVTCNLELDNEITALSGCVRWSKPAALSGSGAGVQFAPLSDDQLALLRRWLAHKSEHAQLVYLHLPNLREPLRARGCVTADGLQLTAALTQFAPGVELEFQLGESGTRRLGRIERVDAKSHSEQGGLELAFRLQLSAATRSRRNLVYGLSDVAGGLDSGSALATRESAHALIGRETARPNDSREPSRQQAAPSRPRPRPNQLVTRKRTDTLQIPKSPTLRLARRGLWLSAALTLGAVLWNQFGTQPEDAQLEDPPAENTTVGSAQAETIEAFAQPTATAQPQPVAEPPAPQAPLPTPDHETAQPQPSPAVSPNTRAETSRPAEPIARATHQPEVTQSAPAAEEARMPALNAAGAKSEVFVPMQGSLRGLRSTQWTDPLAIVLELPDAHIDSPELLRGLRGGGVRRVRLDATREVPRLQIFLNTVAARFATKLVPHGLLVVLEHDLQPLPQ